MVSITKIMRAHLSAISDMQAKTSSLPSDLLKSVSAATLRDTITQVISDIMRSICIEIVQKMKKLGIIVKEPLSRRASADDFCKIFDQFSRKNVNSQNLMNRSVFGLTAMSNNVPFTTSIHLRNLAKDEDDGLSSEMSDIAAEDIAINDAQLREYTVIQ